MSARDVVESLRCLHKTWAEAGIVVPIAFPWAGGEVIEFAADREDAVLGVREFYVLADLPAHQRADFLALLRGGSVVESLSIDQAVEAVPGPSPKKRRIAS